MYQALFDGNPVYRNMVNLAFLSSRLIKSCYKSGRAADKVVCLCGSHVDSHIDYTQSNLETSLAWQYQCWSFGMNCVMQFMKIHLNDFCQLQNQFGQKATSSIISGTLIVNLCKNFELYKRDCLF